MIESKKSLCTCIDHCRIGSLETSMITGKLRSTDHCRIGSLEIGEQAILNKEIDHCRIGSLEI